MKKIAVYNSFKLYDKINVFSSPALTKINYTKEIFINKLQNIRCTVIIIIIIKYYQ